jgi:hypothetical protein
MPTCWRLCRTNEAGATKTRAAASEQDDRRNYRADVCRWEFFGKQEFQSVLPEENHLSKTQAILNVFIFNVLNGISFLMAFR